MQASQQPPAKFYEGTYAKFVPCKKPARKPDFISDSGSQYWYVRGAVIRFADHWGNVASCCWDIDGQESDYVGAAKCKLADFKKMVWGATPKEGFMGVALVQSFFGYKKRLVNGADVKVAAYDMSIGGNFVAGFASLEKVTFSF